MTSLVHVAERVRVTAAVPSGQTVKSGRTSLMLGDTPLLCTMETQVLIDINRKALSDIIFQFLLDFIRELKKVSILIKILGSQNLLSLFGGR